MTNLQIKQMKISDLVAYENNPRKNEKTIPGVARSIEKFGFKQPIVIDSNNVVVCGHTRLAAARLLGLESVPCVDGSDLSPAEVAEYRILDNKIQELSYWDNDLLEIELEKLQDVDFSEFGVDFSNLFQEETNNESKSNYVFQGSNFGICIVTGKQIGRAHV